MQMVELLSKATAMAASDLHIVPDCLPLVRVSGELVPVPNSQHLDANECVQLLYDILTEEQRKRLEQEWFLDFTIALDQTRFRGNIFFQRLGMEAAFRLIPSQIPTPQDLDIPASIVRLTDLTRGLILITGPTGAGKSTTLASLINLINSKRRGNIVTIEDPIEFIYSPINCVVSQREIGTHTPSFASALKFVMRQDPDVLLIGEMRDYETISAALTVAETGHLVFATLHAVDAPQAIDRIIDVFPARQQQQVRSQLAGVLKCVIAQTLLPRVGGKGRVAAREIMMVTPAVSNLIRQSKVHEIYSAIEMGDKDGMISLDRAVTELIKKGFIDPTTASSVRRINSDLTSPKHKNPDNYGLAAA